MIRCSLFVPVLLALAFVEAPTARAERTISQKTQYQREHGARPDIYVPYTTNGRANLGVWQRVQPIIEAQHAEDTGGDSQIKPVWNLISYGTKLQPGSSYNGPTQRKPNVLRPYKHTAD